MPILQEFGKIKTYVDEQGKYRVIWQYEDGSVEIFKFNEYISDEEVVNFVNNKTNETT